MKKMAFVYFRLAIIVVYLVALYLLTLLVSVFCRYPSPVLVKLKHMFYRGGMKLLGGHVKILGIPSCHHPTLFLANHISFLDILLLGGVLKAGFISKAEVAKWPIIGHIARVHGTVFIDRSRSGVKGQLTTIQRCLEKGRSIILFPEGTSSDGTHVLPFKSSFLTVPEDSNVAIQPVTLAYTTRHGVPLGRSGRWLYAWLGDTNLVSSAIHVLKTGSFQARIVFHPVLPGGLAKNRKLLAKTTHGIVASATTDVVHINADGNHDVGDSSVSRKAQRCCLMLFYIFLGVSRGMLNFDTLNLG